MMSLETIAEARRLLEDNLALGPQPEVEVPEVEVMVPKRVVDGRLIKGAKGAIRVKVWVGYPDQKILVHDGPMPGQYTVSPSAQTP